MITTIAFFVAISPEAEAWTPVGGYIDSDTFWLRSGSPYWVVNDVIIRNGANLTIEVGVDVLFTGDCSIYVEEGGVLWVHWVPTPRPYTLFSWNTLFGNPYPGRWRAIQFNDSSYDSSSILKSVIEYATYGVRLESASPTIRNSTIRNCTYGIYSNNGSPSIENNTIENCTEDGIHIVGNDPGGGYPKLKNNTVRNNTKRGVVIYDSSDVYMRNNSISNNSYNFGVWADTGVEFSHDIDDGNTVNNKPIYYWRNHEHDEEAVPLDAGYVGIVNSASIKVADSTLTNNGQGVLIAYSNLVTINNVTATDNELGMILFSSSNNTIENNNVSNNDYNGYYFRASGFYLSQSSNNKITYNTASSNQIDGIFFDYSNDSRIINNTVISNNDRGICLRNSNRNNISGNITSNNDDGIHLSSSSNNTITNNTCNSNKYLIGLYYSGGGIWLASSSNNIIANNTCNSNANGIGLISSLSNTIANNTCKLNTYNTGIYLYESSSNTIINCTVSNNGQGIWLTESSTNTIKKCNVSNNGGEGIALQESSYNNVINNYMWNQGEFNLYVLGFQKQHYNNTIPTSNKVNGKPVHYFFDKKDQIVENLDAGHISLAWCDNVTLKNSSSTNGDPIYMSYTVNSVIHNCNASSNYHGIVLFFSTTNNITTNNISNNDEYGIHINFNSNAFITCNNIKSNKCGVWSGYGSNPAIHNNTISGNIEYGVYNYDPSVYIHAEYNYWGASDGPWKDGGDEPWPYYWYGSGDDVSNHVYFYPYLSSPP